MIIEIVPGYLESNVLFIFNETMTNTGSLITPLDKTSFHLKNTVLQYGNHHWLCIFPVFNKYLYCILMKK